MVVLVDPMIQRDHFQCDVPSMLPLNFGNRCIRPGKKMSGIKDRATCIVSPSRGTEHIWTVKRDADGTPDLTPANPPNS
ncbi:hypothetical protein GCM10025794_01260 [Massilia kyonggiensis]